MKLSPSKFASSTIIIAILATVALTSCVPESTNADAQQERATAQLAAEANEQVGMPAISNFQERRFAKQILEMRDREIATHTYVNNALKGCLVYLGASVGYGLPYAVQFTNPERSEYHTNGGTVTLPQPDPNGLFMPDSLSATWVLLYDTKTKKTAPVYVEAEITVSPFRIKQAECK